MNRAAVFLCTLILAAHCAAENLCARVISLAPSVTEVLYASELGNQVVGVGRYDAYPEAVRALPKIGGLLDPNLETIVSLRPTTVFGLKEQQDILDNLSRLGLRTATLEHRSLAGVIKSYTEIAAACGSDLSVAKKRQEQLTSELDAIRKIARQFPAKRVVVVVYREYDSSTLRDVYLSGSDGYYSDILSYVGGVNIFSSPTGSLSSASVEGLLRLNPDAIIEVLPPHKGDVTLFDAWNNAKILRAVSEGHLYLLDEDWATIPGPRMVLLAKKLLTLLHGVTP